MTGGGLMSSRVGPITGTGLITTMNQSSLVNPIVEEDYQINIEKEENDCDLNELPTNEIY